MSPFGDVHYAPLIITTFWKFILYSVFLSLYSGHLSEYVLALKIGGRSDRLLSGVFYEMSITSAMRTG